MPGELTEITELATALGMLTPSLGDAFMRQPPELLNVSAETWTRLAQSWMTGSAATSFETAFANGRAFLDAKDGLRGRRPLRVEWKGPHRPPGDDVIPADLRIDHVYLISCKYLSKVLLNPGPERLFERLLVGDTRSGLNWFHHVAPLEYQAFYDCVVEERRLEGLPANVADLDRAQQKTLKNALDRRVLPEGLQGAWASLCTAVSTNTVERWNEHLESMHLRLRLLWRMLRISNAAYYVLGTDAASHLRLRIDSAWDWLQGYELREFTIVPRAAGQPEVGWHAAIRRRNDAATLEVRGHVEIRWSHGRFHGVPEAKVYLDSPHELVPGYNALT